MRKLLKTQLIGCILATLTVLGFVSPACADERGFVTAPNKVFVTSVTGTADLSTWTGSQSVAGLIGADNICRARAAAGGLENAHLYVAWLSDAVDDAYCRVHGMRGTIASNCGGLPSLPTFAGPWIRTDGHPFGPDIHLMMGPTGEVYIPTLLDEFGFRAPSVYVFTGTDLNGVYYPGSSAACADWTSAATATVTGGSVLRTSQSWSSYGTIRCNDPYPLLCMLPGDGPLLQPLFAQGALAFATNSIGKGRLQDWPESGGLQGLQAADHICLLRAGAAGIPHPESFKAWISTSTVNAADRVTFTGPWVRPDGVIVAHTKTELVSGELHAPINQTASGAYLGNHGVWTGSTPNGLGTSFTCLDWGSDAGGDSGTSGGVNAIDLWSDGYSPTACSNGGSLYCLSNVPSAVRIFFDGFESGNTLTWSLTTP